MIIKLPLHMETKSLLKSREKVIFSINLNGSITDWSLTAQELFGYKKEELIGTSISSTYENIFSELLNYKERIIKGEKIPSFTSKRMLQDGTLVEMIYTFALNDFQENNEQKILCIIEKILPVKIRNSEPSRHHSKLKIKPLNNASEAKNLAAEFKDYFEDIVSNLQDIIFITDKSGKIVFASRGAKEATGFSSADILGYPVKKLFEKDEKFGKSIFEYLLGKGCVNDVETQILNKNNKNIPVLLSAANMLNNRGKLSGFTFIAKDITERLQKEEEIKYLRNYLDYTIEGIDDAVITVDFEKTILFLNRGAENMFGITSNEIKGKKIWSLFPDEIAEELSPNLTVEKMLKRNSSYNTECRMKSRSGTLFPAIFSVSILKDSYGTPIIGFVFVIKDITEIKKLEQQLLHSEKLASLGAMISGITHELNNKLGPVLGYSQLLKQSNLGSEELEMIGKIELSALSAKKIIQSLLGFSKQTKPELSLININDTIEKVLSLLEYKFESGNLKLETNLEEGLPSTLADGNQIEQVFLNILNNSIQAIGNRLGTISVKSFMKGENIVIQFTDNGYGISEENLKKIFDPFFTTKEHNQGTGLGLSVCYGIIQSHNGKIHAESIEGKKTTFTVELPLRKTKIVKPYRDSEGIAREIAGRKKILIIDDDEMIKDLMVVVMKKNHIIESVNSGEKGLEKIKKNTYDLIITDLRMPVVDGFKLYEWVKENKPGQEKKIIFTTGDTYDGKTKEFLESTQNPFIPKPFNVEDFEDIVMSHLAKL
ncbi:MAG: hypothetical protein A3C43_08950 [Candidatus Schekmanbacteria bacterium RIFCSPHIGHO2_02_FULL_38_11]|uniref:histidine kinase n=1 Tax=Candidatus Schekmanbacteria bacterium RIFCSPLOWO2_12_FULL_38_15 TaxID=1817883 RepID=A0A1F7SMV9_9BACT|nr:MAG: hypothetical protein A2043_09050 [Candidatus Schekmanbacteria bacterium GWA2_38_9]OGL49036.1 MAG: hypothetical protein A3C43_08950 [Candidatus Schekmanbacteria bacterium RIFCSPHIGHO2_02_FULL_38_11]OGL54568.1 MAG: hypothetical protein A3G31_10465 [Candidatus Schekmanbacteria bacterium RIFCSPLOWO2_12_FULL_38_15]